MAAEGGAGGTAVLPATRRQWIYTSRPTGEVSGAHYTLKEDDPVPSPAADEVLLRAVFWSVDPYHRIQQAATNTWEEPHPLGVVQGSGTVGVVEAVGADVSEDLVKVGDIVNAYTGWQTYATAKASAVRVLDPSVAPVSTSLGALGMPARTAYFGLLEAGELKEGDTVLVSGAAGAVGSIVVQIARIKGARVVGIAGSDEKCSFLKEELGAHATVNYKTNSTPALMAVALQEATGKSDCCIDVYFDNTGGWITDTVIPLMNVGGRIVICGQISQYSHLDEPEMGPRFLHHVLYHRLRSKLARCICTSCAPAAHQCTCSPRNPVA